MLPWYITGAGMVVLIVILLVPVFRAGPAQSGTGTRAPFAGGSMSSSDAAPPPLSGDMRENADRLFNRIMQAIETGDSAQAIQFLPMAVSAYEQAGGLDADGLYHLSLLQSLAGEPAAALTTARQILVENPSHLLGLAAAAEAARLSGQIEEARSYNQKIVEVYPTESKRTLLEYEDHGNVLPAIQAEAQRRLK